MSYNLADLLKGALHDLGLDDLADSALDSHSTTTIHVEGRPAINITDANGTVRLWSTLTEYSEQIVGQHGTALLELQLRDPSDLFAVGQPSFAKGDLGLECVAELNPAALESKEAFSGALEYFFHRMVAAHDILTK
ncbi:InvB/SpaK family type III secretion system chaperone [Streptomyces sp. NPDC002104]